MSSHSPTRIAFKEVVGVKPAKVDATVFAQSAFYFQQRRGKLDMRSLARIDIEQVIEETDVGTLQLHLENLTFADLTTDDMTSYTDEHFLKLFRMSQLTIEYLLNVQNALLTYSRSVEEETERLKAAADEGERRLKSRHSKVNSLKRSLKQQRETLKTYESLLKQQQKQQPQSQAPSPGGNIMTASDGTTYVSVEYLKSKAGRAASMSRTTESQAAAARAANVQAQLNLEAKRAEEKREQLWEDKFNTLSNQINKENETNSKNDEQKAELRLNLENEKKLRKTVEDQLNRLSMEHEQNVNQVRLDVQEQMKNMKMMMENELNEQRELAEQARANSNAGAVVTSQRSNAGEMESDSDDELHDRESMGTMRRSKRELAKLVNEQKAELEQFKLQREAMRLSMIEKYINAKKNGRNKTTKTIVLDGWKAYLHGLEHERDTLALRMQQDTTTTTNTLEDEEIPPPPEDDDEPLPVLTRPERNGKTMIPTYIWQKCKFTSKLPYIKQLEFRNLKNDQGEEKEDAEEVRIPPMWELPLTFHGLKDSSGNAETAVELRIPVHRALTINELIIKCQTRLLDSYGISVSIQEGPGSLCLLGTAKHVPGTVHHEHILLRDDSSTVESNHLFVKRPRLVLYSGMTDVAVNEIVERFVKHVDRRLSKNKNRLKKNVREYMEMQDEVIMEELTESGKLTDDYIASLVPVRKQHESTQFVSVLSIGLHEEDDIDSEQNEILSMIKDELNSLGLKKKKKRDGSGKKRIRGLPETDFVMLMEDTEWHLSGQGWPTTRASTPQDMTAATQYFQACMVAEQERAMEDVAQDLSDKKNEMLEARRKRTTVLSKLLTKTSGGKKMNENERKNAIKNMVQKLHGHYFSKLFNVLDTEEETPIVPKRKSSNLNSNNSNNSSNSNNSNTTPSANLLRQSATMDFLPGARTDVVSGNETKAITNSTSAIIENGNNSRNDSETKETTGETKETKTGTSASPNTAGRKVPETPMNDSSMMNDSSNWDDDEDDDIVDVNNSIDISRAADAYEQQEVITTLGEEEEDTVPTSLNDSILSLGRGGASPGARRERSRGAALEEFDDDVELDGSWDA